MIDDSPEVWKTSYGNLVAINKYSGESNDTELLYLMENFNTLKEVANISSIEKCGWRNIVKKNM